MLDVKFIGVFRRAGVSQKSGANYDICMLKYATPMESKNSESNKFTAFGYEEREIPLDPDAMSAFNQCALGDTVKLLVTPNPLNPQRNIVSGLVE